MALSLNVLSYYVNFKILLSSTSGLLRKHHAFKLEDPANQQISSAMLASPGKPAVQKGDRPARRAKSLGREPPCRARDDNHGLGFRVPTPLITHKPQNSHCN